MSPAVEAFLDALPAIGGAIGAALVVLAAGHALLNQRDHRAAVGWIGVILALPGLGALIYWLFGINRVRRRANALFRDHLYAYPRTGATESQQTAGATPTPRLQSLSRTIDRITHFPLVGGNAVQPLLNGDQAYPAMLAAIDAATHSIALQTYIFDRDAVGRRIADALGRAVARGVDVCVLIDAVGARYSFPTVLGALRRKGVRAHRFNRTLLPWHWTYANLRNHRKLLIVDGRLGFTGGLNIRAGHVVADAPKDPIIDLHFQLEGPVVEQLTVSFAEDWHFTTGEKLGHDAWFPPLHAVGEVAARAVLDGPDSDIDTLRWTVLGAIACAQERIRIVTPYFLPETDLLSALHTAALRGVQVEIAVPRNNNQWLVKWACRAMWPELLDGGSQVHELLGHFDHSKLLIVDDQWALIGSANLDPRSLRLNFELNVACHSTALVQQLHTIADAKFAAAHRVTAHDLAARTVLGRLRDGAARLFTPYL